MTTLGMMERALGFMQKCTSKIGANAGYRDLFARMVHSY